MQTRLTTLETKWDTVIPTLATREDLLALEGRLREDMRHGFTDLQRWLDSSLQRWLLGSVAVVVLAVGSGAGMMVSKRWAVPVSQSVEQPSDTLLTVPAVPADAAADAAGDAAADITADITADVTSDVALDVTAAAGHALPQPGEDLPG